MNLRPNTKRTVAGWCALGLLAAFYGSYLIWSREVDKDFDAYIQSEEFNKVWHDVYGLTEK